MAAAACAVCCAPALVVVAAAVPPVGVAVVGAAGVGGLVAITQTLKALVRNGPSRVLVTDILKRHSTGDRVG